MSFWSTVARAFGGAAGPESTPKAVLAHGLGREPEGIRFPTDGALLATDALIGSRFSPRSSPTPGLLPTDRQKAKQAAARSASAGRRVGGSSTPGQPPRLVRPVQTHVEMMHAFILDHCDPGGILDPDEMLDLYDLLCARTGLVERPWKTVAAGLRLRMPPGPEGSDKPYHPFLQLDGSFKKRRAWYVPKAQAPKRRRAPRQTKVTDHQSIPQASAA